MTNLTHWHQDISLDYNLASLIITTINISTNPLDLHTTADKPSYAQTEFAGIFSAPFLDSD